MLKSLFHRPGSQAIRAHRRPTIGRACCEMLESRRLLSFSPAVNYADGGASDIVTADFNNDSILDVAVANTGSGMVSVLLGNANGTFQAATSSPTGNRPSSLAVGDFNGDGNLDLATADDNYINDISSVDVTVLLGNGNGTFGTPTGYEASYGNNNGVLSVAVDDFNGDGTLDIAAASYDHQGSGSDDGYVGVLLGTGAGTFDTPQGWSSIGSWANELVAADFNADGKLDLAVPLDTYVEIVPGDGNGMFGGYYYYDTSSNGLSIVAADFNADGKVDLAAGGNSSVSVLLGNGNGSFGTTRTYNPGSGSLSDLATADFNGDGNLDLIASNSSDGTVGVLLGTGAGAFNLAVNAAVGTGPAGVAVGDFNGDGKPDVAVANGGSKNVSVLLNDGSWTAPPPPSLFVSDATVTEGNTGTVNATFTVRLSQPADVDVTVEYSTANLTATAGGDYTATSGTLTIPAGQMSTTVTVAVLGDRVGEPTETFAVNLSAPTNAAIGDGQGIGTITDDEPRISINNVSKYEGHRNTTSFTFTVTLSAAYDQAVTVNYATASGTATAGSDYQAKSGSITFAPGETTKTITVLVYGDRRKEANETFFVDLLGASDNVLIGIARGVGTIFNDD